MGTGPVSCSGVPQNLPPSRLRPWRVEALLGCGTVELMHQEKSPALLEARDLATDLGLLVKATSAELLLADHRMVVEAQAPSRRRPRSSERGGCYSFRCS